MQEWTRAQTRVRSCAQVLAMALLAAGLSSPTVAAEKDLTDKGEVLVRENCSRCHAVGVQGVSPNPEAPALRTLSGKYPVENLAESLAEGIVSGHPEMPVFVFKPHDIDAIIAYLNSIQEAPADSSETPKVDLEQKMDE